MDYRRLRLISHRNGYGLRDHGNSRPAASARDYGTVVARRIRKQQKQADRRMEEEWLSEWQGDVMGEGEGEGPYTCLVRGGQVDHFWEVDPDWCFE